jgi:hypothetical protein
MLPGDKFNGLLGGISTKTTTTVSCEYQLGL